MEWHFDIDRLINKYTYDVVVHEFGINSGSLIFYRDGGNPRLSTLMKIENKHDVDLTEYIIFENVVTLGDRIKMYRILGYFTIVELAEELEVMPSTLSRWEEDVVIPTEKYITELSFIFGVDSKVFKTEHWKIQVKLEELNKEVKELANEWTHSKNTVNSNLIDKAQELLAEMKVLGITKELLVKQGTELAGEEFVY